MVNYFNRQCLQRHCTNSNQMDSRTLSEVIEDLRTIAKEFDLKLNRLEEFMEAVAILDEQNKLRVDTLKTKEV